MNNLKGLVVEVEGNMGVGKSTLLHMIEDWCQNQRAATASKTMPQLNWLLTNLFKSSPAPALVDTRVFFEGGNPDFLDAFCQEMRARTNGPSPSPSAEDKKDEEGVGVEAASGDKYTFAFQMHMKTTRLHALDNADRMAHQEGKLVFLDRGAIGDTVFAMLQRDRGHLTEQDMRIYYRQGKSETISSKVDLLLFIYVDPETCHRRMLERQDPSEGEIPLAYLNDVDAGYFEMLMFCLCADDDELSDDQSGSSSSSSSEVSAAIRFPHRMPGALRTKYTPANIGRCPKFLALDWSSFGKVEDVLAKLVRIQTGATHSPCVVFWPGVDGRGFFDWNAPHDGAFRARVMRTLIQGLDVHFYY